MLFDFLESVFPFYLAVDSSLVVERLGKSLQKVAPNIVPGQALADIVCCQQPECPVEYQEFKRRAGSRFVLGINNGELKLRGQWIELDDAGHTSLVFAGTVWPESMAMLSRLGLELDDFPAHESIVENLNLRQEQLAQAEDHQRLVQKLKEAAEREADMLRAEHSLCHDLDLSADFQLRFTLAGEVVSGGAANPLLLMTSSDQPCTNVFLHYPELKCQVEKALKQLQERPTSVSMEFELHRFGECFSFDGRMARTSNEQYLLLARDVSRQKQQASRMAHLAHHDQLTQLPNRAYFEKNVRRAIEIDQKYAVLLIDLDGFKSINDCYGHPVGDEVLMAIAERIRSACQSHDLPARLGGDEFAVLAENLSSAAAAEELAHRIIQKTMEPLHLQHDLVLNPSVSLGLVCPKPGDTVEDIFRNVDIAMYSSKDSETERNVICFEDRMLDSFLDRLRLKRDFENALVHDELRVYYQPIVDFRTRAIVKCEALVRWQHPLRGLLGPFEFVELAEETGAILEMGEQVLTQACIDTKSWNDQGIDVGINVNLSLLQIREPNFVEWVLETLQRTGLAPERLTLELTESVLMSDCQTACLLMGELRSYGVRIAIDDFGVGYSSLQYLATLPTDSLKIDKCFIQSLEDDSRGINRRIVESLVSLGRSLGMEIVAEGIEVPYQEEQVRSLHCDYGQGYLYSKPVPFDEVSTLLLENASVNAGGQCDKRQTFTDPAGQGNETQVFSQT